MNKKFYCGLCIASIAISLVAFIMYWVRLDPLNIENYNSIVASLTAIITILIGWQIFNYFMLKDEVKDKVDNAISSALEDFKNIQIGYITSRVGDSITAGSNANSIEIYVTSLETILKSKNYEMSEFAIDFVIDSLREVIDSLIKYKHVGILVGRRSYYIRIMSRVKHTNISDIMEFLKIAEEIPDTGEWYRREEKARKEKEAEESQQR